MLQVERVVVSPKEIIGEIRPSANRTNKLGQAKQLVYLDVILRRDVLEAQLGADQDEDSVLKMRAENGVLLVSLRVQIRHFVLLRIRFLCKLHRVQRISVLRLCLLLRRPRWSQQVRSFEWFNNLVALSKHVYDFCEVRSVLLE